MNGQGLGGILGQLANAATTSGGFGSATSTTAAPPASGGLLGGLFGSVIGALTGGGSAASPESAEILAGLNTLTGMLHSGVQVPPAHQQALDDIMGPSEPAPRS
jgi:hypothetical protein